jgi:RNA polymerase sigma factor (sigma-70 family)
MNSAALTEGEQNRLIIEYTSLVGPIAAQFRGRKAIPFEEIEAEGMLGLVTAARMWQGRAKFSTYAVHKIRSAILDMIDRWQQLESLNELSAEDENRVHEWQVWGILPSEGWSRLPATPEEILATYERIAGRKDAVSSAFLSLDRRARKMVHAHFLQQPRVGLAQIARDNGVSYYRAVEIVYDAVKKMRDIVSKIDARRPVQAAA